MHRFPFPLPFLPFFFPSSRFASLFPVVLSLFFSSLAHAQTRQGFFLSFFLIAFPWKKKCGFSFL